MNSLNICVYRSGGEYKIEHVQRLDKQLFELYAISDTHIDGTRCIPMKYNYPGWWSKMELFRPDIEADLLFFDLDTDILGDVSKYHALKETYVLSDFYFPSRSVGSGFMRIMHEDKKPVWDDWIKNADNIMRSFRGDQDYLNKFFFNTTKRWQSYFPDEICSYKKHVKKHDRFYEGGFNKEKCNVLCYHGRPRPWDLKGQ